MFEGNLVASRGLAGSGTGRWTALGSITLQCALVAVLLAIPMVRPGSIAMAPVAPRLIAPVLPKPVVVQVPPRVAAASTTALSLPAAATAPASGPRFTFTHHDGPADGPPPAMDPTLAMGPTGLGPGNLLPDIGRVGPAAAVTRAPVGPTRVSSGVSEGMLLTPIRPVYPAMARAVGVQGTVVLEATISTDGKIESLQVVSGPPMLRGAAKDAVEVARYRPYKLNGQPTEVQTTITVNFRLGE